MLLRGLTENKRTKTYHSSMGLNCLLDAISVLLGPKPLYSYTFVGCDSANYLPSNDSALVVQHSGKKGCALVPCLF